MNTRLFVLILSMVITTIVVYTLFTSIVGQGQAMLLNDSSSYAGKKQIEEVNGDLEFQNSKLNPNENFSKTNVYSNPNFMILDNQSGLATVGLSSFWKDASNSCISKFRCIGNFSTGWKDKRSFEIISNNTNNNTWSWIYGQNMSVKPDENYRLVTHMKLNTWATKSHVALEGFNETSKQWYQINQCPPGTNGPLEWQEFGCLITIPENITKIRPVLNAGWSSQASKEAITWFDSIYLIKFTGPYVADQGLRADILYKGLKNPTSIAFLGPNDILVSENHNGKIERIINGVKAAKPLLDLPVAESSGLLDITIQKNMTAGTHNNSTYVFVYFTAANKDGGKGIANRLYRYELVDNRLVNPRLLLELPAGFMHNGGQILIGPDKYVYVIVGELRDRTDLSNGRNKALNNNSKAANDPDGRGGILRIDQNGNAVLTHGHGILGDYDPLNKYYAYGIRNSFGMDFDPVTGNFWDTENGPAFGDEINLVKPGFDSGWRVVQGIWTVAGGKGGDENKGGLAPEKPDNLVDFGGKGKYSPPEFTWDRTVGPTVVKFLTTDKLGKQYENDMFVGDANNGRIYHFKLNQNRTALDLQGPLADKVADTDEELDNAIFARGFGGTITDLKIGPDGFLYVVAYVAGKIFMIAPNNMANKVQDLNQALESTDRT